MWLGIILQASTMTITIPTVVNMPPATAVFAKASDDNKRDVLSTCSTGCQQRRYPQKDPQCFQNKIWDRSGNVWNRSMPEIILKC